MSTFLLCGFRISTDYNSSNTIYPRNYGAKTVRLRSTVLVIYKINGTCIMFYFFTRNFILSKTINELDIVVFLYTAML